MEDLRKRVLFTLGMLGVYRMGIFVPAPGIDRIALAHWFDTQSNTLFGLYNMFSGGALDQFSVFVLGIMPYITASIIVQLLAEMEPRLKRLKDEGQSGRATLNQYTRYLTMIISVVQSLAIATGLEQMVVGQSTVVLEPGWSFRAMTALTMTAGSCFIMWLGERITEHGIGNGSSIIISVGILARGPSQVFQAYTLIQKGQINLLQVSLILVGMFAVIYGIVFIERGQRRVPLQHARRVQGANIYEGETTYLPLKINNSGVVPPIFASSLLMLPSTAMQFFPNATALQWISQAFYPGAWLYNFTYVALIIFFAYFYTAMQFNPEDVADNLKKQGGFIPRVRPGRETAAYLDWLLTRLTAGGAVYLAVLCVLPTILGKDLNLPFTFGGTSVLILVGVTLDTVGQIQAKLSTKHYSTLSGPQPEGDRVRNRRRRLGGQGPFV